MPNSELAQKILAENEKLRADVKAHNDSVEKLTTRLTEAEDKGRHTVWAVVGIGFLVFAIALGLTWRASQQNKDQNDKLNEFAYCQATYNKANAEISQIRTKINARYNANTARDNANDRKLNLAVGKIVTSGLGDIKEAFNEYNAEDAKVQKELAKIEADRADNPLPEYPDCYNKYIKESVPAAPQSKQ